jgi:D-amino peptidase
MKVFISVDIEGICGVTHWDETDLDKAAFEAAREQMTAEAAAACQGALEAGATEIWVKDAHASARNLIAARLPRAARLIRGWSGHPFLMMEGLDGSFHCAALVGYHSRAGAGDNPLAHTMNGQIVALKINDVPTSEFRINAYTAGYCQVPLVFVSGDEGLCEEAKTLAPNIHALAVKRGVGDSTRNLHPAEAVEQTRAAVARAVADAARCQVALPGHFAVEIQYRRQQQAYQMGFYPGASQSDPVTVCFEHDDYFEVLRFLQFAL